MLVYSRNMLMSIRNSWKFLSSTARNKSVHLPLPSQLWESLASLNLLARRRGQWGRNHLLYLCGQANRTVHQSTRNGHIFFPKRNGVNRANLLNIQVDTCETHARFQILNYPWDRENVSDFSIGIHHGCDTSNLSTIRKVTCQPSTKKLLHLGNVSARSVKNKTADIIDHVVNNNIDLCVVTET